MSEFLIYGATGYTGMLIAEQATAIGLRPILAARYRDRLEPLAARLDLEWRAFGLDDPGQVRDGVRGMAAVLHAAGPFSATSRPMVDGCLAAGVHYCDITGEIDGFEALAARDAEAKAAGIMLLPGAGFDVVPSDCLAAYLAARLPDASRLGLSIRGASYLSQGTAKTMVEWVGRGVHVRRDNRIVELGDVPRATADFGEGSRPTVGRSWGDVSTAWHSTHIRDIEVFFEATQELDRASRMPSVIRRLLATRFAQRLIKGQITKRMPPGPTPEQRANGRCILLGEAWNPSGQKVASRLLTPDGYALTAVTAVEIARRAAGGRAVPGFQTPSQAFGADFVTEFPSMARMDL